MPKKIRQAFVSAKGVFGPDGESLFSNNRCTERGIVMKAKWVLQVVGGIGAAILLQAGMVSAETVIVDFAKDKGDISNSHVGNGYLLSLKTNTPWNLVDQHKPKLWRVGTNSDEFTQAKYDHLIAEGCSVQVIITANCQDYGSNLDWVRSFVQRFKDAGNHVEYDLANEPGCDMVAIMARVNPIIKSIQPDAAISAPSAPVYPGVGWLQACERAGVFPDIYTWHANWEDYVVEQQIAESWAYIKQKNLPIRGIQINEYLRDTQMWGVQWRLWNLAQLDRSEGCEGAALACWGDCFNGALDGTITPTYEPRSAWYVHKAYADITGRRAGITPAGVRRMDGIMGFDATKRELRGVFSPINSTGTSTVALRNLSSTGFLSQSGTVNVVVQQISGGNSASTGFTAVSSQSMSYAGNQLDINVTIPGSNVFTVVVTGGGTHIRSDLGAKLDPNSIRITNHSVTIAAAGPNTVSIMNMQGKLLSRTAGVGPRTLSLDNAMPGAFLVNVETPGGTTCARIISEGVWATCR
jgi:hypothetical protein